MKVTTECLIESAKLTLIVILVLCIIFIPLKISRNFRDLLKDQNDLYKVSQDSLKLMRNKDSTQTATISILTAEKNATFVKLEFANKDIAHLQQVVKKYEKEVGDLNTAIAITNQTVFKLQDSIRNMIIGYTKEDNVIYPIYSRKIVQEWINGTITMGVTKTDINLLFKNSYDITIGDEKISMFKHKAYANITNLNPNTDTKTMKVYQKEPVKTHTVRNMAISAGAGLILGLIIK